MPPVPLINLPNIMPRSATPNNFATAAQNMIPAFSCWIELPKLLDPAQPAGRLNRIHYAAVKFALKEVLKKHHTKRVPEHFNYWKQKKYHYDKRSDVTKIIKKVKKHDEADLVKTRKSKESMQRRIDIRIGGSAAGGNIEAKGLLRWKPGMQHRAGGKSKLTLTTMASEIARWTGDEQVQAGIEFTELYMAELKKHLTPRQKRRIAKQPGAMGAAFRHD